MKRDIRLIVYQYGYRLGLIFNYLQELTIAFVCRM